MLKSANEIFEYIRQQVRKGNYKPNDSLPPIRDLAEMLGVNRNTVSSAYQKLVVAGLSLIHISEPTRPVCSSRMPSSA